jgi:hypothetical protein
MRSKVALLDFSMPCGIKTQILHRYLCCAPRGPNSLSPDHLMLQTGGTTASGRGFFEQRSPVPKERDRHAFLSEVITP